MSDPHASFMRAQREFDNRLPPEAVECPECGEAQRRFMDKVDMSGECWLWTGHTSRNGYGQFKLEGRIVGAHRAALILAGVDIPEGMDVCHHCDVRNCVRWDHLFIGTRGDNMRDAAAKGRTSNSAKTHCKSGHPFDEENTRVYIRDGEPRRSCRKCERRWWSEWEARQYDCEHIEDAIADAEAAAEDAAEERARERRYGL